MKRPTPPLTAAEACGLLNISPDRLAALRSEGLAPSLPGRTRAAYSASLVEGLRRLLAVTRLQEWPIPSLSWYADLAFASEVGRVVLLPIMEPDGPPGDDQPSSWFGTPHAAAVLRDLEDRRPELDEGAAALVRSLLNATLSAGQCWKDKAALRQSALWPVIEYLQAQGHAIFAPDGTVLPEGGEPFALLVLAFGTLAPPIAGELRQIVQATYGRLRRTPDAGVPVEEQQAILKEQLVAVDKLYASRAAEIHAPLDDYKVNAGVMVVAKRTVALQLKLPLEYTHSSLDNILDIIRPYLGVYGARVVQALYEVANDPPYWRSPIITIDTNHLLDRLGEKRDGRGIHYSRNRARLRDTLN
nr:hypothetical protein [Armatimonadota bacterium]